MLLRARLIATYPRSVIDTLSGLVDGQLPTAGAHLAPGALYLPATDAGAAPAATAAGASPGTASSATAGAVPASPLVAGASALRAGSDGAHGTGTTGTSRHTAAVPGSTPAPPPQVAAARAEAAANVPRRRRS